MQEIPSTYDYFDGIEASIEYRCLVPYYYWRMDLELTPEQAQGTYQCQSGNLEDGFTTKTIIFFDKSDKYYTPATLTINNDPSYDSNNGWSWLEKETFWNGQNPVMVGVTASPALVCRIDGLLRTDIEQFQWQTDDTTDHGDMSEPDNTFPLPLFNLKSSQKSSESAGVTKINVNCGDYWIECMNQYEEPNSKLPSKPLLETPWGTCPGNENLIKRQPKEMLGQCRPQVVKVPGREQTDTCDQSDALERFQIKYSLSISHLTRADLGSYSCAFDHTVTTAEFLPHESKPFFHVTIISVDMIDMKPDNGIPVENKRKGISMKWSVPVLDPCSDRVRKSNLDIDPQLTRDKCAKSECSGDAICPDIFCKQKGPKNEMIDCHNLDNIYFSMAITPQSHCTQNRILIEGLNKRYNTKNTKQKILTSMLVNDTDCEKEIVCHLEREFSSYKRCDDLVSDLERQKCYFMVSNGMMEYTCGCTSWHEIDTKSNMKIPFPDGYIKLDTDRNSLLPSTKYTVKIKASLYRKSQLYKEIHSMDKGHFITPGYDYAGIKAPEISRIGMELEGWRTIHWEDTISSSWQSSIVAELSVCWELANDEESSWHQCQKVDTKTTFSTIGPLTPGRYLAYTQIILFGDGNELESDKSLYHEFKIGPPNPILPIAPDGFELEPGFTNGSITNINYKWKLPYVDLNYYLEMSTLNGTNKMTSFFNPGIATITKKRKQCTSVAPNYCHRYTKPMSYTVNLESPYASSIHSILKLIDYRNLPSREQHAVYLARKRSAHENSIFPACNFIKGSQLDASDQITLSWRCPKLMLNFDQSRSRPRPDLDIIQQLELLPAFKNLIYFHIEWTYPDLMRPNYFWSDDRGWYLPLKQVNRDKKGIFSFTVSNPKFASILNSCAVLSFRVRFVLINTPQCLDNQRIDQERSLSKSPPLYCGINYAGTFFFCIFHYPKSTKIYPFLGSEFSNTLNLQVKLKTTVDSIGDLVDNLIYSFKSKSLKVSPSFEAELISLQFCCIMIRVHVM